MAYIFAGAFVLVAFVVLGRAFVTTSPRALVRFLRYFVGIFLIIVGGILLLAERWGLALPAIVAGISAISVGRIGPLDLGGSYRSAGQRSGVTSNWLEMSLDHDTGAMDGTVRQGTYAGRRLDELDEDDEEVSPRVARRLFRFVWGSVGGASEDGVGGVFEVRDFSLAFSRASTIVRIVRPYSRLPRTPKKRSGSSPQLPSSTVRRATSNSSGSVMISQPSTSGSPGKPSPRASVAASDCVWSIALAIR